MKWFFPVSSLVIILIVLSCKKFDNPDTPCPTTYVYDNDYDTVMPSSYLMTYPGSRWEYSDGSIDSCSYWEGISVFRSAYQGNCQTVTEDKQFLPVTNYGHISFDSYVNTYMSSKSSEIEQYLDTVVGVFIDQHYSVSATNGNTDGHTKTLKKEVVELFNSYTVGGTTYSDVIHVHVLDSTYYYHVYNGPFWRKDFYYAKNVGLIRESISFVGQPTVTRELVNYYIAPH